MEITRCEALAGVQEGVCVCARVRVRRGKRRERERRREGEGGEARRQGDREAAR